MPKRSPEAPASKDNPKTRRCRNCPKMFTTIREYQHFCSARCRWEFHHYNNTGFGRVKHLVEKMLARQDAHIAELEARLKALEVLNLPQRVDGAETQLSELRLDIGGLHARSFPEDYA